MTAQHTALLNALVGEDSSVRLQAALAAGSNPDPVLLDTLVRRCAVEPDFFVRDTLSRALTRLPSPVVLPRLREELDSEHNQARSQALHTLSKINDTSSWAWITPEMLHDTDDDVARTAWRAAVVLVPQDAKQGLAAQLVQELGRGTRDLHLSLTRALIDLGESSQVATAEAANHPDHRVAQHARATELLRHDPETGFDSAMAKAQRTLDHGPRRPHRA